MNLQDVENLAELSKLELSQEEKESLLADMGGILDYVKQIESVEVGDIVGTYSTYNAWREDATTSRDFSRDSIIAQFPHSEKDYLKVKKIL